jgi:hypothetical protein
VSRFLAGFAAATVVWVGAAAGAHFVLGWGPPAAPEENPDDAIALAEDEPDDPATKRRRGGRRGAGSRAIGGGGRAPTGEATTGDDLREGEMRTIDGEGSGGEQQLTGAQIDGAFDGAMGRIRRCFILAAGDEAVTGRLTFGMRIAGTGQVTAVSLSGPAAVTTGECGDCLRTAARAIRFDSFDGPEMLIHYPITLE